MRLTFASLLFFQQGEWKLKRSIEDGDGKLIFRVDTFVRFKKSRKNIG